MRNRFKITMACALKLGKLGILCSPSNKTHAPRAASGAGLLGTTVTEILLQPSPQLE